MIRRFLAFWRRRSMRAMPFAWTRVRTDLTDTLQLHAGDSIHTERNYVGFRVVAYVLRDRELQCWPLFHCEHLREAENIRVGLDKALADKAPVFYAGSCRAKSDSFQGQEVAF